MGKRTTIETDQQPSGKEIRIPATTTIKSFNSSFNEAKETIDGANEELKGAAEEAKKKHLHLSAFKDAKKLFDAFHRAKNQSIAAEKLASYLANFDHLRKHYELDKLANLQGRMFAEGEIGGEPKRETDEDGEPDLRPRHLRQPDASGAAAAVQNLADMSGAKRSDGPAPIDQVGRGKTPPLN